VKFSSDESRSIAWSKYSSNSVAATVADNVGLAGVHVEVNAFPVVVDRCHSFTASSNVGKSVVSKLNDVLSQWILNSLQIPSVTNRNISALLIGRFPSVFSTGGGPSLLAVPLSWS
jgi:hypothetical protein